MCEINIETYSICLIGFVLRKTLIAIQDATKIKYQ